MTWDWYVKSERFVLPVSGAKNIGDFAEFVLHLKRAGGCDGYEGRWSVKFKNSGYQTAMVYIYQARKHEYGCLGVFYLIQHFYEHKRSESGEWKWSPSYRLTKLGEFLAAKCEEGRMNEGLFRVLMITTPIFLDMIELFSQAQLIQIKGIEIGGRFFRIGKGYSLTLRGFKENNLYRLLLRRLKARFPKDDHVFPPSPQFQAGVDTVQEWTRQLGLIVKSARERTIRLEYDTLTEYLQVSGLEDNFYADRVDVNEKMKGG